MAYPIRPISRSDREPLLQAIPGKEAGPLAALALIFAPWTRGPARRPMRRQPREGRALLEGLASYLKAIDL